MATLATGGLSLPNFLASGVWSKVQTGSALAVLSQQTPMMFGTTQYMTFTTKPKGEVVAEGANKSQSQPGFGSVTVVPRKVQVTQRFTEEVIATDDARRLGVLTQMADAAGEALARALDLIAFHGINPKDGVALTGSPAKILDTTNSVEVATATPDSDLTAAVGLVIADGFTPSGVALDPAFSFALATEKDTLGHRLYPNLGFGTNLTNVLGLDASVSTTVSGSPEATVAGGAYATTNPNVKAIVGDFRNAIRWGVQREIPLELIRYGDPDGNGDLKRTNEIALRAEVFYGLAIFDVSAFAKVIDATA